MIPNQQSRSQKISGQGYYTQPTVFQSGKDHQIVFVCENDLWQVPLEGGRAQRLTSTRSEIHSPHFSPCGNWIACCTMEEGEHDVYLMESEGSPLQRLTWLNSVTHIVGWSPDGKYIWFRSTHQGIHHKGSDSWLYQVSVQGGPVERLPYGPAMTIDQQINGNQGIVLGRNALNNSRWKRYRGGMTGEIWVDPENTGDFKRLLKDLPGNPVRPIWLGDKIWFVSDHDGIGNLYSCTVEGKELTQQTFQKEYYVRFPSISTRCENSQPVLVYHVGGELWMLDPQAAPTPEREMKIPILWHSTKTRLQRRFFYGDTYWEETTLHPQGHEVALTARGKLFSMPLWEQAVRQHGLHDGVRYRCPNWLPDGRLVAISDVQGLQAIEPADEQNPDAAPNKKGSKKALNAMEEQLDVFGAYPSQRPELSHKLPKGRIQQITVSPVFPHLVMTTSRMEMYFMNAENGKIRKLDVSQIREISEPAFSPDGRWLAYTKNLSLELTAIFLIDLNPTVTGKSVKPSEPIQVTSPVRYDFSPSFDPDGRWLYFLSSRTYNPIWDTVQTGTSFSRSMKPYLLTLKKDTPNPFVPRPHAPGQDGGMGDISNDESVSEQALSAESRTKSSKTKGKNPEGSSEKKSKKFAVEIDLEGIQNRVIEFPVSEGVYEQILGLPNKAIFTEFPLVGALDEVVADADFPNDDGVLWAYDFEKLETETLADGIGFMQLSAPPNPNSEERPPGERTLLYSFGDQLKVVEAGVPSLNDPEIDRVPSRKTGWLDLSRVRISVHYPDEWAQMFREAWRLQKEFFWTEDLSGVDWEKVYQRYVRLLPRIGSRSELSDLIWEMQGELGTSHAYEYGGDYPYSPRYPIGCLGADLKFDQEKKSWIFQKIYKGDIWKPNHHSPLAETGVAVEEGDRLLGIGGIAVDEITTPGELLVNQAGQYISLTIESKDARENTGSSSESKKGKPESKKEPDALSEEYHQILVKTLAGEQAVRYREWVENNSKTVDALSGGKVGYLHIPDMGTHGIAEFHRGYLAQVDREGLIVDIRYNAGGMVSPLILEKLSHRHLGYDVPRWGKPESYPYHTLRGHIMVIANQYTGSDGDMFSASFRQLQLGLLIGKRTWGGVIGIDGRYQLADGTTTTQPQYSIWFHHAGWSVENHGVEPDVEVEDTPQSYIAEKDEQLTQTIQKMMSLLEEQPVPKPIYLPPPKRELPN